MSEVIKFEDFAPKKEPPYWEKRTYFDMDGMPYVRSVFQDLAQQFINEGYGRAPLMVILFAVAMEIELDSAKEWGLTDEQFILRTLKLFAERAYEELKAERKD